MKLAVIFPGIGYHKDKPLLYYAAKLAVSTGFEVRCIDFHDMPKKILGNAEMLQTAAEIACQQAAEQLAAVDWSAYDEILLIGKSIGTVAAAKYASDHRLAAKQIWYTPLRETFSFAPSPADLCTAFLGSADPWSDTEMLRKTAAELQLPLYLYPDCNHSLESSDVLRNIENLHGIMQITERFIRQSIH